MKIEELLDKYFDGETSCQEERELRRFFMQQDIPEHLKDIRPLFVFLEQEHEIQKRRQTSPKLRHSRRLRRLLVASGCVCAVLLLAVGIVRLTLAPSQPQNFVLIDGQLYTDSQLVKEKAWEAMTNVGFTDEEIQGLLFLQP